MMDFAEFDRRPIIVALETAFSDPVGERIAFLEEAVRCGYVVVLCYTESRSFVRHATCDGRR